MSHTNQTQPQRLHRGKELLLTQRAPTYWQTKTTGVCDERIRLLDTTPTQSGIRVKASWFETVLKKRQHKEASSTRV